MRAALLGVALLLALPVHAAQLNHSYRVTGDLQAAPVQAFDDGRQLFVQLRNPMDPPAPIGPAGPVAYQIRGPYLVLPLMPHVRLRFGPYEAAVVADGNSGVGSGVVSITRPVEANDASPAAAAPVAPAPALVAAPAPAGGEVSGEIEVSGPAGVQRSSATALRAGAEERTLAYAAASRASAFDGLKARPLELRADGTTDGARAVLAARSACVDAGATCRVTYKGAPAGTIQIIVENNG